MQNTPVLEKVPERVVQERTSDVSVEAPNTEVLADFLREVDNQGEAGKGLVLTGTGGLEHLMPQFFASWMVETKTAYTKGAPALVELVKNLQLGDTLVQDYCWYATLVASCEKRYESKWWLDSEELLLYDDALYVLQDAAVRNGILF